jgi:hypothetical protein
MQEVGSNKLNMNKYFFINPLFAFSSSVYPVNSFLYLDSVYGVYITNVHFSEINSNYLFNIHRGSKMARICLCVFLYRFVFPVEFQHIGRLWSFTSVVSSRMMPNCKRSIKPFGVFYFVSFIAKRVCLKLISKRT